jgi:chemotaxis protein methyltransferase CheR
VRDEECVAFLQWALPRLGFRWQGFRKVRRQVCRRIDRRLRELHLQDVDRYRLHLETHPEEWELLDALCRIPISRFYRDSGVFDRLTDEVLPELAARAERRPEPVVECWSVGCASGEEPYTLRLVWELTLRTRFPAVRLRILGTDIDENLLRRAREGRYRSSSVRALPRDWVERAFEPEDRLLRLRPEHRAGVELRIEDVRSALPDRKFDLILCRNLAFTYFDGALQRDVLARLVSRLEPGGFLVIGAHESLPAEVEGLRARFAGLGIFRKAPA